MSDYFVVDCPCRASDRHAHEISNPNIIKLITSASLKEALEHTAAKKIEKTGKGSVNIFYFTCDKSNHECKAWIDTQSGETLRSECKNCH